MNKFLAARLQGIHQTLWASYDSGNPLSSSSKGHERETFIGMFLSQLLPPIYRFGTGDITAVALSGEEAKRSGQIDIVIEMPWAPSFCIPGTTVRLYPAEAVGVAIEIKSDIGAQWSEVISTATALGVLRQALNGISVLDNALTIHNESVESVPLYAVGYKGWSTADTVREKVNSAMLGWCFSFRAQNICMVR